MLKLLKDITRTNCPDCGVNPAEYHLLNCDIERCPKCNSQLISCGCFTVDVNENDFKWDIEKLNGIRRKKWTGVAYEKEMRYCEDNNLWVKWTKNGWEATSAIDPNRIHDINTATEQMTYLDYKRYEN